MDNQSFAYIMLALALMLFVYGCSYRLLGWMEPGAVDEPPSIGRPTCGPVQLSFDFMQAASDAALDEPRNDFLEDNEDRTWDESQLGFTLNETLPTSLGFIAWVKSKVSA